MDPDARTKVNRTVFNKWTEMKVMAIYYFLHSIVHLKAKTTRFSME